MESIGQFPPQRVGPRPMVTPVPPHRQLEQFPSAPIIGELLRHCFALPHIFPRPSVLGIKGTYALRLAPEFAHGPVEAFLTPGEFAHIHPLPEGSLHLTLPHTARCLAEEKGWAEPHPMTRSGVLPPTAVLLYAPRNGDELGVVLWLVNESHKFAMGPPENLH